MHDKELFKKSKCMCDNCIIMNHTNKEWAKWEPATPAGQNYKNMVDRIEQKYVK